MTLFHNKVWLYWRPYTHVLFLISWPSKNFGRVYIHAGKWYLEADNHFHGQLWGTLQIIISFRKFLKKGYWYSLHYKPDRAAVKDGTAWMREPGSGT